MAGVAKEVTAKVALKTKDRAKAIAKVAPKWALKAAPMAEEVNETQDRLLARVLGKDLDLATRDAATDKGSPLIMSVEFIHPHSCVLYNIVLFHSLFRQLVHSARFSINCRRYIVIVNGTGLFFAKYICSLAPPPPFQQRDLPS